MHTLLAIDTCGPEGGVAIARIGAEGVATVAQRTLPGRETQERLMTAIQEVLVEAEVTIAEISAIAVAHGPGSFTGVRIGVAAAKGLAEALTIPVVAISRLRLLAARATSPENVTALLDAGRGDVYAGRYSDAVLRSETMTTRDAVANEQCVVGEEVLRKAGTWVGLPTIADLISAAAFDLAAGRFADVALLDANYLRIPDAELALKARQ